MGNKHNSLNLAAKICSDICPWTLSVPRSSQFSSSFALSPQCRRFWWSIECFAAILDSLQTGRIGARMTECSLQNRRDFLRKQRRKRGERETSARREWRARGGALSGFGPPGPYPLADLDPLRGFGPPTKHSFFPIYSNGKLLGDVL